MNANRQGQTLTPELKALIDSLVVPCLVRSYLAEHGRQNELAPESGSGVECAVESSASAGRSD